MLDFYCLKGRYKSIFVLHPEGPGVQLPEGSGGECGQISELLDLWRRRDHVKGGARVGRELQCLHNLADILQVELETLSILILFSLYNTFPVSRRCLISLFSLSPWILLCRRWCPPPHHIRSTVPQQLLSPGLWQCRTANSASLTFYSLWLWKC